MRRKRVRLLAAVTCGLGLLASLGCVVAADALNPGFFAALGFDPNTIFPSSGTVIVAFTNTTSLPATFYAYESADAQDLSIDSRNFSVGVESGETRNEVLACPVGVLSPGSLGADFSVDSLAAEVQETGGVVTVTYEQAPLIAGADFRCGDVVDIQLYATGGTGEGAYEISVRLIPGG